MKSSFLTRIFLTSFVITCLISGCLSDNNNDNSSHLSLALTDGAIDFAEQVNLTVTGVELKSNSDNPSFTFPARTINLLSLQGSQSETLFTDEELPAGEYQWLRLMVDSASIVLEADGGEILLTIPSSDQTGFKLVSGFTLPSNTNANFTLDFDVRKSITVSGPVNNLSYKLRPTMRLVNNIEVGHIQGTVNGTLCDVEASMAVYAYENHDAVVDDEGSDNPPVTSSLVSNSFDYEIGFLTAGNYTIALTCMADDDTALADEAIIFIAVQNVLVAANQTDHYSF